MVQRSLETVSQSLSSRCITGLWPPRRSFASQAERAEVRLAPPAPKLSPFFSQAKSRVSAELERPEPSYLFTTPRSIREQAQHCQFRPLSRCIGRFNARVGRSAPGKNRRRVRTLVEVQSETSKDMKDAQAHLDQNVLGQLRRGSLGLDSGLSGGLFSAAGRPCQRPATLFGANVALENRD